MKQAVDEADDNIDTNELTNGWISPSEIGKTLAYNDNDNDNDNTKVLHDENYSLLLSSLEKVTGKTINNNDQHNVMKKIVNKLISPQFIKDCLREII